MPTICQRVGVVMLVLLSGCATWRQAVVPMRVINAPARGETAVETLLVMLPGSYSPPEEFQSEGFVNIARIHKLVADIQLTGANVGYYHNRSVVERLAEDVVRPARAQGYRQVWLVGISIGAVGAMLYANAHPEDVDGIVLTAPFLGTPVYCEGNQARGWAGPLALSRGRAGRHRHDPVALAARPDLGCSNR